MKELLLHFTGMMRSHRPRTEAKGHLRRLCCALLFLMLSTQVFAQNSQVSGRVTDGAGAAMPGVTVKVKGTTTAVSSDLNGRYVINADANGTLEFSFVGFAPQEIKINGQKTIDVQLKDDSRALNEVVVIGYQTIRKKDLTGAVAVVNTAEANKITSNSVAESLQGLSPGVTIRTGGAPGEGAVIEIRGVASFVNSAPLYDRRYDR